MEYHSGGGWRAVLEIAVLWLVFVMGRGGAGFHSRGPAVMRARGAIFRVIPAASSVRGESPLIPWTGPVSCHPI